MIRIAYTGRTVTDVVDRIGMWIEGFYLIIIDVINRHISSLFIFLSNGACVNSLGSGDEYGSDFAVCLEVAKRFARKASIDLELFHN